MVDSQLRTSGVTMPWVIAAMGSVAREGFVPVTLRNTAYMDRALPVAGGHMLNPPIATALMLQAAEVVPSDNVLLVGTPGGYMAAVLARRTADIVVIETAADLTDAPHKRLFSLILIDGAVEELPGSLLAAAQDGARIVTGIVERGVTRLATGYVRGGKVALRPFADTEITPLPGFAAAREFVF